MRSALAAIWFMVLVASSQDAQSNVFKDVAKAVGGAVKTTTKIATAPVNVVIGTAKAANGGSVSDIYRPYVEIGKSAADNLTAGAKLVSDPQQYMFVKAQEYARKIGGDTGSFVFDVGTFSTRMSNELGYTAAAGAANILRGQNPLQVTAAPLAAAIRAARQQYASQAQPLPPDVRAGLADFFSPEVLDRARYTVGRIEINLPNFIGRGAKFMGNGYAVTVDDTIVFNSAPPSFADNATWWAHEVTHVEQYGSWGVDKFAFEYVIDFGHSIERSADQRASTLGGTSSAAYSVTPAMMTSFGGNAAPASVSNSGPEYFVARCSFPNDPYPVQYMVTNTNRIIAIDMMTGQWIQIGWAMPPLLPNVAWTYQTANFRYAVSGQGEIFTADNFGKFFLIGQVQRLN